MSKLVYVDCLFRGGDGLVGGLYCFADGLVVGFSCFWKSLEDDLPCGPKLGVLEEVFVLDVVELATFKTVEALMGAFFFSTSWVLENVEGTGGGGAGPEIMDSNTSFPSVLTPRHFDAVPDTAWTNFSGRLLLQNCG